MMIFRLRLSYRRRVGALYVFSHNRESKSGEKIKHTCRVASLAQGKKKKIFTKGVRTFRHSAADKVTKRSNNTVGFFFVKIIVQLTSFHLRSAHQKLRFRQRRDHRRRCPVFLFNERSFHSLHLFVDIFERLERRSGLFLVVFGFFIRFAGVFENEFRRQRGF
jgi:hypothetical protein